MEGIMVRSKFETFNFMLPCIIVVGLSIGTQLAAGPAEAEGAVALGRPADIAKAGVAIGISSNYADNASASANALERCLANKDAPQSTKSLCAPMAYFKDQCAAVAIDRKAGTPGFGWAIGVTKARAQSEAMASCKATAGKGREQFCENSIFFCDGTAGQ
jgi:hypothetical protein